MLHGMCQEASEEVYESLLRVLCRINDKRLCSYPVAINQIRLFRYTVLGI